MKLRMLSLAALAAVLCSAVYAQDPTAPGSAQTPGDSQPGQRGNRGFSRGMMGQRGVVGTVADVTPDHFTIKNDAGETWTILYSANTRFSKQPPRQARTEGQGGTGAEVGSWQPQTIKPSEIKSGDVIVAMGQRDEAAKSIGAMMVMQVDPERARQMREMQANFGKTWLMGRVSAINETKITVHSGVDNADHTFAIDENTSFRRRRDPVTLADLQVGDNMRVEGAVKDGQFVATTVNVMMPPAQGGPVQRQGPPPQ